MTVGILIAFAFAEKTPHVHAIVEYSYDWLQTLLKPLDTLKTKIVVVDISDVPMVQIPGNPKAELHTPREPLLAVVNAIHAQGPAAIGLDVDFSFVDGDYVTPGDPVFLGNLTGLEGMRGKVFVGVSSGLENGPSNVLGKPDYAELVAYIVRPDAEGFGPNPRMDEFVEFAYIAPGSSRPTLWHLPSLAASLAATHSQEPQLPGWALRRRVRQEEGEGVATVAFHQFLVDFSPIDEFERHAIRSADLVVPPKDTPLRDKIVIVGRGSNGQWKAAASETFTVPGHRQQPYPGVFLQACATYTLRGATLWELTMPARVVLDFAFSIVVFGSLAGIAWFYNSRVVRNVAVHRLNRLFTWGAVITVVILGQFLVNWTRIMWPDYVLLAAALLVHSSLEQPDNPLRSFGEWIQKGWRSIALQRQERKASP